MTGPHIWRTLGYRRTDWRPGATTIEWRPRADYCFPTADGPVVQGAWSRRCSTPPWAVRAGRSSTIDQVFLTADLRVEFLRVSRPGVAQR